MRLGDKVYHYAQNGFASGILTYTVVEVRESVNCKQYVVKCEDYKYAEERGEELILIGHVNGSKKKDSVYEFVSMLTQDGWEDEEYDIFRDESVYHNGRFFTTKKEAFKDFADMKIKQSEESVRKAEQEFETAKKHHEELVAHIEAALDALNE